MSPSDKVARLYPQALGSLLDAFCDSQGYGGGLLNAYTREIYYIHKIDKKFWEELIAYFPCYDTGHVENDASNNSSVVACVFVTAVRFLPSRCLATIGEILLSRCLATMGIFTEPLPNNDRGIHRHRHIRAHTQTAT
jgi:hypothetical protein